MVQRSTIKINRAAVLTRWAAIVAERLGFDHDEALTLGRAVARLNAYSKGVSLGLIGYARTSTTDQQAGLEAQRRNLKAAGCKKLFEKQVSSVGERAQLDAAKNCVRHRKNPFSTWGNSGIEPDEGKGISSPGTYEAILMWPRSDGERQWNTMSDWTYR